MRLRPKMSSLKRVKSVPETAMPILVPTAPDKADGFALNLELSSFRIEEQPLRQLKKMPKLAPGLWNEELMEVLRLVNAIKSQNQKEIASIVERIVRDGSVKLNGATVSAEELAAPENLTRYIGAALTTSMRGSGGDVRFVLWFDKREQRLRTGLLCPNDRAAAFVMLLYNQHL